MTDMRERLIQIYNNEDLTNDEFIDALKAELRVPDEAMMETGLLHIMGRDIRHASNAGKAFTAMIDAIGEQGE